MHRAAVAVPAQPVALEADGMVLQGDLRIPQNAGGIVVFAHGSGLSRLLPLPWAKTTIPPAFGGIRRSPCRTIPSASRTTG